MDNIWISLTLENSETSICNLRNYKDFQLRKIFVLSARSRLMSAFELYSLLYQRRMKYYWPIER